MTGANWIRFVHSQDQIKEILDYCVEEKKKEREKVLDKWRKWMKDNTSGISSESYQEGIIRIMQLREGKDGE